MNQVVQKTGTDDSVSLRKTAWDKHDILSRQVPNGVLFFN
jgi:hypothetical protein